MLGRFAATLARAGRTHALFACIIESAIPRPRPPPPLGDDEVMLNVLICQMTY